MCATHHLGALVRKEAVQAVKDIIAMALEEAGQGLMKSRMQLMVMVSSRRERHSPGAIGQLSATGAKPLKGVLSRQCCCFS